MRLQSLIQFLALSSIVRGRGQESLSLTVIPNCLFKSFTYSLVMKLGLRFMGFKLKFEVGGLGVEGFLIFIIY